mgnify:CR=1 FL=1
MFPIGKEKNIIKIKLIIMSNIDINLVEYFDIEFLALMFDQYRQFYDQKPDLYKATNFIRDRLDRLA